MRPVFLDSRGTRRQAKSRNHHINATQCCSNYDTPSQRPRNKDNIEVGYSCLDCKHRKNTTVAQKLCAGLLACLVIIIMLVALADSLYRESVNAQSISNAYQMQYEISRTGDVQ